jgi:hypothetical protein
MPEGRLTIDSVWWKGAFVKFVKASIGPRDLPLNPDGTLTVTIDSNIDGV